MHYAVLLGGFFFDGLHQVQTVHAVDEMDERHNQFDFIGLQMSDKVPSDIFRQCLVFSDELLGMTFAEIAFAGQIGLTDGFYRLKLTHTQQIDMRRKGLSYFSDMFLYQAHDSSVKKEVRLILLSANNFFR